MASFVSCSLTVLSVGAIDADVLMVNLWHPDLGTPGPHKDAEQPWQSGGFFW